MVDTDQSGAEAADEIPDDGVGWALTPLGMAELGSAADDR
jgi:hypothetical protein